MEGGLTITGDVVIIRTLNAWSERAALPRLFPVTLTRLAPELHRLAQVPPLVWIGIWAVHVSLWLVVLAFRDAATLGLCVSR